MKGILGKKIGMTQVFTTEGKLIPVTVIEVEPNVVTQIKTVEKDGYEAVQLLKDGIGNRVVAYKLGKVVNYDIYEALNMEKGIDEHLYEIALQTSI